MSEVKFMSLDWFKSKVENTIEKVVAEKLVQLMDGEEQEFPQAKPVKLYTGIKLVNDVLTVILEDGSILCKQGATEEDFRDVQNALDEAEIKDVFFSREGREIVKEREAAHKKALALQEGVEILKNLDDFTVEGNSVYLSGTSRSIPPLLVERFIYVVSQSEVPLEDNEEYQALKNFFMWCCLNPRAEVANELYRFLQENSFRITKQGFFVALRNVVTVGHEEDKKLVEFVSNAYNKIKAIWKKNPQHYMVVLTPMGEYELEKICAAPIQNEKIGILSELYLDLPNMEENRYTDAYTGTFDIRVGQLTTMPQEECNWSTQDCATAGLHFTSDQIHYVGCGDTSVLILINPMKVVGIGQHKGRCYEYLPIMTVPSSEATRILHDGEFDTLQLDELYAIDELEKLAERAKEGFATEVKKYQFNLPAISNQEIQNIVLNLSQMKEKIDKRVSLIK